MPDRFHPFIEQMGLEFDALGAPRMMGRIVGYLLVCHPPHQSARQLGEALGASKGSINTLTRQLIQSGMLERVAIKGERATFVQVWSGAWSEMLRLRMERLVHLRITAESGLALMADLSPERRQRLQRFRDFYAHVEREFEDLVTRFEEENR